VEDSPCDLLECALVRYICGMLTAQQYLETIEHLHKQGLVSREQYHAFVDGVTKADDRFEWAYNTCLQLHTGSSAKHPVHLPPLGAAVVPLLKLTALIEAGEKGEESTFLALVREFRESISTCRAVSLKVASLLDTRFDNPLAANVYYALGQNGCRHCQLRPSDFENLQPPPFWRDALKVYRGDTYGFEVLTELGLGIVEARNEEENQLLSANKPTPKEIRPTAPTLFHLKRFNSFSPIFNVESDYGGGLFLWTGTEGVVVDPGFDFTRTFLKSDLSLDMIQEIIITHAHPDHLADCPNLLTAVYEQRHVGPRTSHSRSAFTLRAEPGRGDGQRRVRLTLSLSAYTYLSGVINLGASSDYLELKIVRPGDKWPLSNGIVVTALPTVHRDCIGRNMGFGLFFVRRSGRQKGALLYTSDTALDEGVLDAYRSVVKRDHPARLVALCNVGGTTESELDALLYFRRILGKIPADLPPRECRYGNHLGILGVGYLAKELSPSGILISEMGYELKSKRIVLAASLSKELGLPVLPADVGMTIQPFAAKVIAETAQGQKQAVTMAQVESVDAPNAVDIIYASKQDNSDWQRVISRRASLRKTDAWRTNLPWGR